MQESDHNVEIIPDSRIKCGETICRLSNAPVVMAGMVVGDLEVEEEWDFKSRRG